ncbi:MAG: hypothetical protein ABI239_07840 [Aquihabitans sp.]
MLDRNPASYVGVDRDEVSAELVAHLAVGERPTIKVNVTPLSLAGWTRLLDEAGFDVDQVMTNPLHLLEPRRLIADEGVFGALRFASRVARDSAARERVLGMRRAMQDNAEHLQSCAITAIRRTDP